MKIYLIRNEFDNGNGETENTVKAYATHELAEQNIKPIIDDEIQTQLDNGVLVERNSKIEFEFMDEQCDVEISPTRLALHNGYGFSDDIWIEEIELIGA